MEIAQTADHALSVLEALEARDGQTVAEITQTLGLSRSVVHRLLETLHRRALITRAIDGRYVLGPGLLALAAHIPTELALRAGPHLDRLTLLTGETVVLAAAIGSEAEVVASRTGHAGALRVEYTEGFRHPLDRGASGLAILAFVDDPSQAAAEPQNQTDLDEVRRNGYALTEGQIRADMAGLAVPVLADERVVASLALITPRERISNAIAALDLLHDAARSIGSALTPQRPAASVAS